MEMTPTTLPLSPVSLVPSAQPATPEPCEPPPSPHPIGGEACGACERPVAQADGMPSLWPPASPCLVGEGGVPAHGKTQQQAQLGTGDFGAVTVVHSMCKAHGTARCPAALSLHAGLPFTSARVIWELLPVVVWVAARSWIAVACCLLGVLLLLRKAKDPAADRPCRRPPVIASILVLLQLVNGETC